MTFYRYRTEPDEFAGVGLSRADSERITDIHFHDVPLGPTWIPPLCHAFSNDRAKPQGDFPSLANYSKVPVASEQAWEALRPLMGYCCEALPIVHPSGKPFFIIHVMETIDCLDKEWSEFTRSKIDGRINRIYKYRFNERMLDGKHIFKLPLESAAGLFVDDEFRKAVEGAGLQGLSFNPLPMA